jgi:hypothetical protein
VTDINAFPLSWPLTYPRTKNPSKSKFGDYSFAVVRDNLMKELKRFGATKIVLSTNIPLRLDGLPKSGMGRIKDAGVAVYFKKQLKGQLHDFVFACDRWEKIEDNIYSISKTIDALRGIDRWGSSDMQEKAFTGYMALPPAQSTKRDWKDVLEVAAYSSNEVVKQKFNQLAMRWHPDRGGDAAKMAEINRAYAEFKIERGL